MVVDRPLRYYNWCAVTHGHSMMPDPNGAYIAYEDYQRLQRELQEQQRMVEGLRKALRDAREAMRRHDDADFQCESVAGAEGARECVEILDAAIKEKQE